MPVLVVAGGEDAKFTALAERMADAVGDNATLAVIEGAGHAAHLEQPDAFLAILRPWLAAHGL
jgi:pimeloyl-ACP methyl ester carboxylesterase